MKRRLTMLIIIIITTLFFVVLDGIINKKYDFLKCELKSLHSYGLSIVDEEVQDYNEFVCANVENYADFIVIEDRNNIYKIDGIIKIQLNDNNEIAKILK